MNTFLPYPNYTKSAECLDNRRLNKGVTEVKQIYLALTDPDYGWQHHPAVLMWRGYEHSLLIYGSICYAEWQIRLRTGKRGGKLDHKAGDFINSKLARYVVGEAVKPFWFGDPELHSQYRACLLHKDFEWYSQFEWSENPAVPDENGSLPYVWPAGEVA